MEKKKKNSFPQRSPADASASRPPHTHSPPPTGRSARLGARISALAARWAWRGSKSSRGRLQRCFVLTYPKNLPPEGAQSSGLSPVSAPSRSSAEAQSRSRTELRFIKNYGREREGMGPFLAQRGKESAAGAPKSCPVHVPWHAGHWHGPQRWSPVEVNASNGTKVGSGEGTPLLGMGQPHRTTCLGPTRLQTQWDPESPCSHGATEGLRVPGAQFPQPPPCCIPWGEAPEVQTDGQGARSCFQLLFCSPSAHPTGRAVPVPIPVPIRAPPRLLPGSGALIYDLLGDKRGLLAAASNWCAGTTVAICLLGRWGGRGWGWVLFLLSCTTKLCTFCFPAKGLREPGRKRGLPAPRRSGQSSLSSPGGFAYDSS